LKFKKASIFTKLVVLILMVYSAITLISLNTRIEAATVKNGELKEKIAQKTEETTMLAYSIQHKDDPATIRDVARARLGMIMPGEIIFYDVSN
jgi:cell division protein DivIC